MRVFGVTALLLFAALSLTGQTTASPKPTPSQHPAPPSGRIQTRTRLVSLFSGMENRLFSAVQKKDQSAITPLLSDEFEIWTPNETGDPIPLEDWLATVTGNYELKSFRISQMSARDFGSVVVVKFVYSQKAESQGKDDSGEYFMVDAWEKQGDSFKLSDRYVSRYAGPQPNHPAHPTGKQ